jgi:hypothetical protein
MLPILSVLMVDDSHQRCPVDLHRVIRAYLVRLWLGNLIIMTRSYLHTGGRVSLALAVSIVGQLAITTAVFGCVGFPQDGSETTAQSASSRRVDGELEPLAEELQLDRPQPDDSEPDDSEPGESKNDKFSDRAEDMDTDELSLDDEELDDEELDDDLQDDDSEEGALTPFVGPVAINTDTRSLRVNIAESDATAPADQSGELIAQSLGKAIVVPSEKRFAWAAPDIRYQPLYFENVPHERYGQTPEGCEIRQTVLSAAHFFGSAALLPYKLLDQHPQSCDGPLGFCRPGSETPFVWQRSIVR